MVRRPDGRTIRKTDRHRQTQNQVCRKQATEITALVYEQGARPGQARGVVWGVQGVVGESREVRGTPKDVG